MLGSSKDIYLRMFPPQDEEKLREKRSPSIFPMGPTSRNSLGAQVSPSINFAVSAHLLHFEVFHRLNGPFMDCLFGRFSNCRVGEKLVGKTAHGPWAECQSKSLSPLNIDYNFRPFLIEFYQFMAQEIWVW